MASMVAQTVKMTVITNSFIVYLPQQWAVNTLYWHDVCFSTVKVCFICCWGSKLRVTSVFDSNDESNLT